MQFDQVVDKTICLIQILKYSKIIVKINIIKI